MVDVGESDLQGAVPHDTLVALLKRKDKDVRSLTAKLEKLEERYVKIVRINKICMEDRASFQRFCGTSLPESSICFEEAAAQETPVDLDLLLQQQSNWKATMDCANEDRGIFRQFVEMVFPGDEEALQALESEALGTTTLNKLQEKWTILQDLHNQSIASVNTMAREQVLARSQDFETIQEREKEAREQIKELTDQLTQFHREKALRLTQRLTGGGGKSDDQYHLDRELGSAQEVDQSELHELMEKLEVSERQGKEARQDALSRQDDLRKCIEQHREETQRLKREIARLEEANERHRLHGKQSMQDKDISAEKLRERIKELENDADGNAFIVKLAEQQASRDAEVRSAQQRVVALTADLAESQRSRNMGFTQERALKERIRELEGSVGRTHVAGDYLKHVVMKYMEYSQSGDLKAQGLVPVICTLLKLSPEECKIVETPTLPQSLLLINNAFGGANSWFKRQSENAAADAIGTETARDVETSTLEIDKTGSTEAVGEANN